jgi:threonine/homoserine/homoserine lactone efflux protein
MIEGIITVFILGIIAGLIFSMPVVGPINVLIVSNALKGRLRYCLRTAVGASIIEFIYVVIIIYGITTLYEYYRPLIPYLLLAGALVLLFIGYKILKTRFDISDIDETNVSKIAKDKIINKGGLRTGIIINLTNPSLFLGWVTSTFIIFSFASALNLNTGGLDIIVSENISALQEMAGEEFEELNNLDLPANENTDNSQDRLNPVVLSLLFAGGVAIGSMVWLVLLAKLVLKYKTKLKIEFLTKIMKLLGIFLLLVGFYLGYKSFIIIF